MRYGSPSPAEQSKMIDVDVSPVEPPDNIEMKALAAQLCSLMIKPADILDAQAIDRCAGAATLTNSQPAMSLAELIEHPIYQAPEVI